jgi:hypothetical protein
MRISLTVIDIRIPANIAGSASNPSEGGRPQGNEDDNE